MHLRNVEIKMVDWISHRGVANEHDENTAAAFAKAVANGYGHLETDLRITRDGQVILWHDPTVTDQSGRNFEISKTDWDVLGKISLPKKGKLLTLKEFMLSHSAQGWTLDIKPETGIRVIEALAQDPAFTSILKSGSRIKFLFWEKSQIDRAEQVFGSIQRYATKNECILAGMSALVGIGMDKAISPRLIYALTPTFCGLNMFSQRVFAAYHLRGARLLAYLPTTPDQIKKAIELGIDEILSDLPSPIFAR